jgi:selenoprotein W-related protein
MDEFEHSIDELTLIPSRGGVFEVTIDGDLVYSKKATGRHATYDEIAAAVRPRT